MGGDARGVGLYQYCHTADEQDLFWYYQEADRDLGMVAFCPTDAGGEYDAHAMQIARRGAAARHSRIRVVLKKLELGELALLEGCYTPRHLSTQVLRVWGLAAGVLLVAGAQLGAELNKSQKKLRDDALAATATYCAKAAAHRRTEVESHSRSRSAATRAREALLWVHADKRRKRTSEAVERAAALISEIGGTGWLDMDPN